VAHTRIIVVAHGLVEQSWHVSVHNATGCI
jgi:hypothetical protein